MFNLKDVQLDAADAERVRALNDKTAGVQRMIDTFIESGERRMSQLQQEGRVLFTELGAKYKLDLKRVQYVPSQDGNALTPVAVNLKAGHDAA